MLCNKNCLRNKDCKPISNIVSDNSFVCVGLHNDTIKFKQDKFRHCFKTVDSDSMFDYDEYDLISVISVFSEALLSERIEIKNSLQVTGVTSD